MRYVQHFEQCNDPCVMRYVLPPYSGLQYDENMHGKACGKARQIASKGTGNWECYITGSTIRYRLLVCGWLQTYQARPHHVNEFYIGFVGDSFLFFGKVLLRVQGDEKQQYQVKTMHLLFQYTKEFKSNL